MAGKKGIKHFSNAIIAEVIQMKMEGKTNKEISDYYDFKDKRVIKNLINRYNRKQRQSQSGVLPRKKGRPRKSSQSNEATKDERIRQLEMENDLLRSFLFEAGRR